MRYKAPKPSRLKTCPISGCNFEYKEDHIWKGHRTRVHLKGKNRAAEPLRDPTPPLQNPTGGDDVEMAPAGPLAGNSGASPLPPPTRDDNFDLGGFDGYLEPPSRSPTPLPEARPTSEQELPRERAEFEKDQAQLIESLRREKERRLRAEAEFRRVESERAKDQEQLRRRGQSDTGNDGDEPAAPRPRKRTRNRRSEDDSESRHQQQFFAYFYSARLTADDETAIFHETESEDRSTRLQAIYDGAVSIFGDDLSQVDITELTDSMRTARSEARSRIRTHYPEIFGRSRQDIEDDKSSFRRQVSQYKGLAWTFQDFPQCTEGYLQSQTLLECMSALLYGPHSIGKSSAESRAASGLSKGNFWKPKEITKGFVAFTCAVTSSVLRNRRFHTTRQARLEVYDDVLDLLETRNDTAEVLGYFTEQLIPATDQTDEHSDADGGLGNLTNPDFARFRANSDGARNEDGGSD